MAKIKTLKSIEILEYQEECILKMIADIKEQLEDARRETHAATEAKNYKAFIEQTMRSRFLRNGLQRCRESLAETRRQIRQEEDFIRYWES